MKPDDILVTDHALVRWLERVHGVDMEFFRRRLVEELAPIVGPTMTMVSLNVIHYALEKGKVLTVMTEKRTTHRGTVYRLNHRKGASAR